MWLEQTIKSDSRTKNFLKPLYFGIFVNFRQLKTFRIVERF